jgi:hypothetical protein
MPKPHATLWLLPLRDQIVQLGFQSALSMQVAEFVERVEKRSGKVLEASGLAAREIPVKWTRWESEWNRAARERELVVALGAFGQSVYISVHGTATPLELAQHNVAADAVLLDHPSAGHRAQVMLSAGLPCRWEKEDAILVSLAEELYYQASERLGHASPLPVVEEAARGRFVQEVLGLPFNPWIVTMLAEASRKVPAGG